MRRRKVRAQMQQSFPLCCSPATFELASCRAVKAICLRDISMLDTGQCAHVRVLCTMCFMASGAALTNRRLQILAQLLPCILLRPMFSGTNTLLNMERSQPFIPHQNT